LLVVLTGAVIGRFLADAFTAQWTIARVGALLTAAGLILLLGAKP
jgi:hypothetical protein